MDLSLHAVKPNDKASCMSTDQRFAQTICCLSMLGDILPTKYFDFSKSQLQLLSDYPVSICKTYSFSFFTTIPYHLCAIGIEKEPE